MRPLRLATWAIGAITALSGAVQIAVPGWELALLNSQDTAATRHLFATVGMFMVLFGGLLLHALRADAGLRFALLWTSLQKFGAAVAVTIGVISGVFSGLALGVAVFDLASGLILLTHLRALRRDAS